jgi:hypothetical protein
MDWRERTTIEERTMTRDKIREAYAHHLGPAALKGAGAFLEVAVALEEELLFQASPGRLDYIKGGFAYRARIARKMSEISAASKSAAHSMAAAAGVGVPTTDAGVGKRRSTDNLEDKKTKKRKSERT